MTAKKKTTETKSVQKKGKGAGRKSEQIVPVREQLNTEIMEKIITTGDISGLSPAQRVEYYLYTCKAHGLDASQKPFDIIKFRDGKTVLYANKGCTEQLRDQRGISVTDTRITVEQDGTITATAIVQQRDGRTDSDVGVVWAKSLTGDALANAKMKAVTKAKRRATLSLCGMGMLDESETETIPNAKPATINLETGEIKDAGIVNAPVEKPIEKPMTVDNAKILFRSSISREMLEKRAIAVAKNNFNTDEMAELKAVYKEMVSHFENNSEAK
jgi:hypothetical protein